MLGGVAGGLGDYLDFDSTIIRLIFAFSVFLGGAGFVAYLLMWLVVPEAPIVTVSVTAKKTVAPKPAVKKSSNAAKKSAS
ncbi:MAG: PspC domain-containing protein [Chloroflexi bacterium]|nr:PspC domain-containing protein [Chloroflexota bacterium]